MPLLVKNELAGLNSSSGDWCHSTSSGAPAPAHPNVKIHCFWQGGMVKLLCIRCSKSANQLHEKNSDPFCLQTSCSKSLEPSSHAAHHAELRFLADVRCMIASLKLLHQFIQIPNLFMTCPALQPCMIPDFTEHMLVYRMDDAHLSPTPCISWTRQPWLHTLSIDSASKFHFCSTVWSDSGPVCPAEAERFMASPIVSACERCIEPTPATEPINEVQNREGLNWTQRELGKEAATLAWTSNAYPQLSNGIRIRTWFWLPLKWFHPRLDQMACTIIEASRPHHITRDCIAAASLSIPDKTKDDPRISRFL